MAGSLVRTFDRVVDLSALHGEASACERSRFDHGVLRRPVGTTVGIGRGFWGPP
jgi:hypothetical protein